MITLMKRDFLLVNKWFYITMPFILLALFYLFGFSITWMAFFILVTGLLTPFVYDEVNKTYIFFDSLPVKRKTIVQARYMNNLFLVMTITFIMFVLNALAHRYLNIDYALIIKDIIVLFSYLLFFVAISLPHLFRYHRYLSFVYTFGQIVILFFIFNFIIINPVINESIEQYKENPVINEEGETIIFSLTNQTFDSGLHLSAEMLMPWMTYIVLPLLAITTFILSYYLSVFTFNRRDLTGR
ncbi:MAG TPA: ABC-2 transporter permease [Pseudogracilibacillus sp.]|nr:ABC-2 transporter permease [Pseudogracilibacillus sp.]